MKDELSERLRHWLSAPDPSVNYHNALRTRHMNTGTWLLNNPVCLHWKAAAGPLLWLYGMPGCGKTILSSYVLHDVLANTQSDGKVAMLYFSFEFNEKAKQSHENMIRSLLTRLFTKYENLPKTLHSL